MKSHSGSHFFPPNCRDVRLFSYWLTAKFEKQRGHCSGFVAKERCEQTAGQRLIKGEGEKLKKVKKPNIATWFGSPRVSPIGSGRCLIFHSTKGNAIMNVSDISRSKTSRVVFLALS